jgi:purine-binding chemotaxis protein CheW
MAMTTSDDKAAQYLTIRLGADEYGIALDAVREIVPLQGVTRVPGTPPWVRGVCNLRGTVLPVVDLGTRFGFGETAATKRTCFLVLELPLGRQTLRLGVVAESVSNVIEVRPADIEAAPEIGLRLEVQYVRGLVRTGERFVVILDVFRVFDCEELVEVEEAAAPAPAAAAAAATPAPAPVAPAAALAEGELPSAEEGGITFY